MILFNATFMLDRVHQLRTRKDVGATAVEYSLLAVAIAAVIVITVFAIGGLVHGMFTTTCTRFAGSSGGTGTGC